MELYRSPGVTGEPETARPDDARGTPPLARRSMTPRPWGRIDPLSWMLRHDSGPAHMASPTAGAGLHRRVILLILSLAPALYATWIMSGLLPNEVPSWPEMALLALFAVLSCWVAAGFWTALMGFSVLWRGRDRYLISRSIAGANAIPDAARTAIVMPICNEDVRRVFAGLRATYESLARTGEVGHFDFFVLSDSNDPDICVAELDAWNALRDDLDANDRIFYRRRLRRVKRKSGNIDDFCRRWGGSYRYMVVLDADSVMSGDCLTTLVRLMEVRPDAGIIQTAPQAAGRDTLHARVQQFASHVYGPLFTAGLHYWQLGESHYWGHNAIIRLEPFIRHCALAPLPGRGALAGEILSHDFVEAALMRRAGYGVWIAYDLDGSYEETPPNLLDEVKRDRRWCQGNLMNARLMFARGIHPVHRTVFLTGTLAYASAALWFGFLALSSWLFISHANADPQYFIVPHQLFPLWPSWQPEHALALVGAVAVLLFLPKVLAGIVVGAKNAPEFGGGLRLAASLLIEMVLSALLAPIRMVFHTRFVLAALMGWSIQWKSPSRADDSTPWREALRRHGGQSLLGLAWVGAVAWYAPDFAAWLAPVAAGLILSVPLSVFTSRASLGSRARRLGLFLTPAETRPPHELNATAHYAGAPRPLARFADAVVDPEIHATVVGQARTRRSGAIEARRNARVTRALTDGPAALSRAERMAILDDAIALDRLHRAIRSAPAHPAWFASSSSAGRATITHFGTRESPRPTVRVPAVRVG